MTVRVTSYKNQVMQRLLEAFDKTAQAYDANLHLVLRLKRNWAEPPGFGVTRRRNKTIVAGNYRNLYDLGDLDRSQNMVKLSRFRVRYSWSAPHAVIVHEGAVLRSGSRIPARRFTRVAAQEANLPQRFADCFNKGAF